MPRTAAIGHQNFATIIENDYFYIDKTAFIREWWESGDSVTLITRPRRFGKTLALSMVEQFFSAAYANREDLFERMEIWKAPGYPKLQGTYPVISLSFASVKEKDYGTTRRKICFLLARLYDDHRFLAEGDFLSKEEKEYFGRISPDMSDDEASMAINQLSAYLARYYGKKVIVLLDEYDTPMQEAYVNGYWEELAGFTRNLFNAACKTNSCLERALLTGITCVSKESIFSDLNNLKVVTTTSQEYAEAFGFTQKEVARALEEYGLLQEEETVREWYDGFQFGEKKDIYNPWSILNFLNTRQVGTYWANTSSNSLISKLIREGDKSVKQDFETLLRGGSVKKELDEQIIYEQLDQNETAVWSLLLACGYLKVKGYRAFSTEFGEWAPEYELELTNFEVKLMFRSMIKNWFGVVRSDYNEFVKALLSGDAEAMNVYMNRVAFATFSFFDTGKHTESAQPERFYHGFVLGLMVDLVSRYVITSNRESGFGRYDIMLEPRNETDDAILLEFKVFHPGKEKSLEETAAHALAQIEEKGYEAALLAKGIGRERIRKYGFAFEGKRVLIGEKKG